MFEKILRFNDTKKTNLIFLGGIVCKNRRSKKIIES